VAHVKGLIATASLDSTVLLFDPTIDDPIARLVRKSAYS
jgi:hypothetical protein